MSPDRSAFACLTRFIATVGPACSDEATLGKLIEAGVSIFRLNFSHGEMEEHAARLRTIREVARRVGRAVAVLGDLQGPKIRVGKVGAEGIELAPGRTVVICPGHGVAHPPREADPVRLDCTFAGIADDVRAGQRLLIADGAIRMLVTDVRDDGVHCTVTTGGRVSSGKGINLPDTEVSLHALTDRDRRHVAWAVAHDVDLLALSFVRNEQDVVDLRALIGQRAEAIGRPESAMPIVAKIELPGAVRRIEAITDAADAIMVARGDLGVEMDLAQVPVVQKRLLAVAQDYGKPCIVATQMLESMIEHSAPTRAEASDVAGAIFDGADAVMLSGETAVGRWPVLAVEHMRRIAIETEAWLAARPQTASAPERLRLSRYRTAALAHGAWTIAQDVGAKCIVTWSESGGSARYLSQNNFTIPIVAMTSDERVSRRMALLRGVVPLCVDPPEGLVALARLSDAYLIDVGLAAPGDPILIMAGHPIGVPKTVNAISYHQVAATPE